MPKLPSWPSPKGYRWLLAGLAMAAVLPAAICCTRAAAADVTQGVGVSAVVLDQNPIVLNPTIQFSGYAGSGAALTITRGSTVVYTAALGGSGQFDVILADQPVGEQTYVVAAQDDSNRSFSALTFILNLQPNTATILSNVFLGPSISADKTTLTRDEQITISGITVPLSAVTFDFSSVALTPYSTTSNAAGVWRIVISGADLGVGTFTAHARSVFSSITSGYSPLISFSVTESGTTNTNTAPPGNTNTVPGNTNTIPPGNINTTPGTTNTNTALPDNTNIAPSVNTNRPTNVNTPLVPPTTIAVADFNTDSKVNLIDFSILMYYWHQQQSANPEADINHDGVVDIIDVSIMLFQWHT